MVKADGSWPRGRGFKPQHRLLDECKRFASYYIKEKLENKGSKMGHTKKIFKKIKKKIRLFSIRKVTKERIYNL